MKSGVFSRYINTGIPLLFAACAVFLAGCAQKEARERFAPDALRNEEWVGRTIGVITGTVHDQVIAEYIPGSVPAYFNDIPSSILALKNGQIDGLLSDVEEYRTLVSKNPGLVALEPYFDDGSAGMLVSKEKPELLRKINDFLARIRADGTYDDMYARWVGGKDDAMPDIPQGTGAVLRMGTSGVAEPFAYFKDGEIVGFDVEFARRFAAHENMKLDITVMDFAGLIPSVQTGKIDYAASCFAITEERKQSANYTDPYYTTARTVCVYDPALAAAAGGDGQAVIAGSVWQRVVRGVERNLIRENRWKMILDGLRISLIITLFAFVMATLLGFAVCALRMSGNPILRAAGSFYITVLRGTPVVVLLMFIFYVIFAKSSVSGVWVAVIAFGLNGAAFIGEIIRSAVMTIDRGQIEAARSMGFGRMGVFFVVTLPQAARAAFPVYMSEFVSMFKMTSVVGYIAIIDLTKAGDIIRSRTYDAFFPLVMVAIVYLASALVMIYLFDFINNRLTSKSLKPLKH